MQVKHAVQLNPSQFQQSADNQTKLPLSNPQDQLLFKLPSIRAKKHALKMLANEVRSLGSDSNSNLKAIIIILLKLALRKQVKFSILQQLIKQTNNVENELSTVINHPFDNQDLNALKAKLIQQLNDLIGKYKENIVVPDNCKGQLFIQAYLTRNSFFMQMLILLIRIRLCRYQITAADNYKIKVETKIAYQVISETYDLNCRLMDEYYIFDDQSLLIASWDGKQYVYGKFYKDQIQMRRSSKLSASTLEFLNLLSANNKKRKQILMESKSQSETSQVILDNQNLLTPSFQLDNNMIGKILNKMKKSQQKKQQIRINFEDQLDFSRNEDFGQLMTNIQMIESMHQQISVDGLDNSKIIRRTPKKSNKLKKQSEEQTQMFKEKKQNVYPHRKEYRLLDLIKTNSNHSQPHIFNRNLSFEFRTGAKSKHQTKQLKLISNLRQSKQNRFCFCKEIAKKKIHIDSNIYSLTINQQLAPISLRTNKIKQSQFNQKKEEKRQDKGSRQFHQIFRKKNIDLSCHRQQKNQQQYVSPYALPKQIHIKTQPAISYFSPFGQRLIQQNKMDKSTKHKIQKIAFSDEFTKKITEGYTRNVNAICSPKPFNLQSKGLEFKGNKMPTFKDSKIYKNSCVFNCNSRNNPPPNIKEKHQQNLVNAGRKSKLFKPKSLFENYEDLRQR